MIDNRGHDVPLCHRSTLRSGVPRHVRGVVARAELGSRRSVASCAMALAVAPTFVAASTLLLGPPPWRQLWPVLLIATFMLPVLLAIYFGIRFGRQGREEHAREAMLAIGRCPSCAYELRCGAVESDGCTVCPECGAAWRLGARSLIGYAGAHAEKHIPHHG